MMMREYEYCLDTCSLYVSSERYIRRKKIWMDGDGYRGKDTRPHTAACSRHCVCVPADCAACPRDGATYPKCCSMQ